MDAKNIAPEDQDLSFLNRITFWWFNNFIFNVNNRTVTYADLYDNQKQHNSDSTYQNYKQAEDMIDIQKNQYFFWSSLYQVYKWSLFWSIICSLALVLFNFLPSLILNRLIHYLMQDGSDIYLGITLAILLLIVPLISAMANQFYQRFMYRLGLDIEITLQNALYRRILHYHGKSFKFGELINIVSFDARQVGKYVSKMYFLWQTPVMIWISLLLLYIFCGNAVFLGLIAMLCFLPFTVGSSLLYSRFMDKYYRIRDDRGRLMDEILVGMKMIKFYSLEEKYEAQIKELRSSELYYLRLATFCDVFQSFSQKMIVISGSVTTIVISAFYGETFDVTQVFTTLSFFNILEKPILGLGENFVDVSSTWLNIKRIQKFLEDSVRDDFVRSTRKKEEYVDSKHAFSFEHANFEFDRNHPVLDDIHFTVPKKSLVCITGEAASGKTSLLHAMCGNLSTSGGSSKTNGSIALCTQNSWLLNSSIRDNILFGRDYDEKKYRNILSACCLDQDLSKFSLGDETVIERGGSNIPANLQHKISLARACYSERDIVLVDSILSSMDRQVQRKIFDDCIRGYLKDKTVVLVTNENDYHTKSDKVIQLDQGRMKELSDFLSPRKLDMGEEEVDQDLPKEPIKARPKVLIGSSEYVEYFKGYGTWFYVSMVLVVLFSVSKILLGWWISMWSSGSFKLQLYDYALIYISLSLIHAMLQPVHRITFILAGMRAMRSLHNRMVHAVIMAPMLFFEKTQVGEILNRFMDDVLKLDAPIPFFFINFFGFMSNALITIAMICIITPPSFFFILLMGVLFGFVWFLTRKPQLVVQEFTESSRDPISSLLATSLNGLVTIQAYQNQSIFAKEFSKRLDYHTRSRWIEIILYRWLSLRLEALASIVVFSSAIFSVILKGTIAPEIAALAITYSLTISEQFNSAMNVFISAEGGLNSFRRVAEYANIEPESTRVVDGEIKPYDWPPIGKIEFQGVSLKYEHNLGLENFTCTFGPNEIIGIVGQQGSGRTSLFVALYRLIGLESGKITIDDGDISNIDLSDYRARLSIIPQEQIFLAGNLRNNIDPLGNYSDYLIWNVLDEVHLKRKLEKLEITLNDAVDCLQKLSFGEKQLLSVARCLLYDTRVILIDDALSHVDSKSKRRIEEIISGFKNKTVLIIAPKGDSLLKCCKKGLLLTKGKLIEYGSMEELESDKNSNYSKMK